VLIATLTAIIGGSVY